MHLLKVSFIGEPASDGEESNACNVDTFMNSDEVERDAEVVDGNNEDGDLPRDPLQDLPVRTQSELSDNSPQGYF